MMKRRRGLNTLVAEYHRNHPNAPVSEIAAALSCGAPYVVATGRRLGLTFPKVLGNINGAYTPSEDVFQKLKPLAEVRKISISRLIRQLVEVAIHENMVDAILDDREAA